ncbi:MAG: hypothetical protein A3E87_05815 [Gammaproteobacteria bacterium RIFCSPHIGHO2_12_FULL_35_23]|nr:MAG: hypothetical protein A3E87_05815 [Gammaproteobacteria bacterium RIFCSPHIGHO2_12_FULL_35_23]
MIAQKYKLIGPDPTLSKLTDKTYVQQIISEFSPPSITFDLSNLSDKKITSFIEENNNFNEFLLKPAISSGAVDIFILDKEINADLIKNIIIKQTQINASKFHRWMLQSRINGRLYSLEGFVKDGHINFLGFSRRVRKELTECINEFPVDEDLTDNLKQQCMQAVAALIQRSNYRNGYFHSEFIIKNLNAYFIDANMGRIAGGAFIHRLSKYYEIDATDIITHVIDLGLFKGEHTKSFQYKEKHQGRTLTINYCLSESALVWNVTLPSQTTSFHTVVANNGKVIPAIGFNDCAWVGFLAGFKEDVLTEIDHIIINTNKGPMRPFYVLFEEEREVIEPVKKINHD